MVVVDQIRSMRWNALQVGPRFRIRPRVMALLITTSVLAILISAQLLSVAADRRTSQALDRESSAISAGLAAVSASEALQDAVVAVGASADIRSVTLVRKVDGEVLGSSDGGAPLPAQAIRDPAVREIVQASLEPQTNAAGSIPNDTRVLTLDTEAAGSVLLVLRFDREAISSREAAGWPEAVMLMVVVLALVLGVCFFVLGATVSRPARTLIQRLSTASGASAPFEFGSDELRTIGGLSDRLLAQAPQEGDSDSKQHGRLPATWLRFDRDLGVVGFHIESEFGESDGVSIGRPDSLGDILSTPVVEYVEALTLRLDADDFGSLRVHGGRYSVSG